MDPKRRARIDEIVAEAWRLEPAERALFVGAECGDDPDLRREVDSLVKRGDEAEIIELTVIATDAGEWSPPALLQSIGPYQIESEIGRGGMGVVLRARDPRLGRAVALKALPLEFARDRTSLARFRQEARSLAAIDHPNVAVLHDLQEHDGTLYLVMELVEGPTLRERLQRSALPVEEVLSICAQVAAGLEAAHEQRIIHRDLKPDNVKLTARGTAKVLDFGIAKRSSAPLGGPDSPGDGAASLGDEAAFGDRASPQITRAGRCVGTPGYCAPEQLRGEEVDAGADLFALGCLLYECLTRSAAFPGSSALERATRTLSTEPNWDVLPERTPRSVVALLRSCLARSRPLRPASVSEVRRALERALAEREWAEPRADAEVEVGNLPSPLTSFVGRAKELTALRAALRAARLLTLTGVGGCGKTRLAIEGARSLTVAPVEGAWLVELAALADPLLVPVHVAATLGLGVEPGADVLVALARYLRGKDALLILDNCEHLVSAVGDLAAALLRAAPGLRILATSREPLGLDGERVFVVPSLDTPGVELDASPGRLAQCEAVTLFVDRAQLGTPSFRLDASTAPAVAAICRRLDGIPLALELAAARLRVFTVDELVRRLEDRFGLLTGGARGALPRHQALQATMDWSHDLLAPAERSLFRRLAVFAGGFTLAEAEEIASGDGLAREDVAIGLGALADKSLVMSERATRGRFSLLETVRQYAQGKLFESAEGQVVRERHAVVYLELAERSLPALAEKDQAAWLARLDAERDNMRAALEWLSSRADAPALQLRLAIALWRYWDISGAWREGRDRIEAAIARAPADTPHERLGSALRGAGWLSRQVGDRMAALAWFEKALGLERADGDKWPVAATLLNLGILAYDLGESVAARARFEEALSVFSLARHERGMAATLNNLGLVEMSEGRLAAARARFEESSSLLRALGDELAVETARLNLASILTDEGRTKEARTEAAAALAAMRRAGDRPGVAEALVTSGHVALASGDPAGAHAFLAEAAALMRELGHGAQHATGCLSELGVAIAREGDWVGARSKLLEALDLARELGGNAVMAGCARDIALALIAVGKGATGARLLGSALALAERDGPVRARPAWRDALFRTRQALGREVAVTELRAGLGLAMEDALAAGLSDDAA